MAANNDKAVSTEDLCTKTSPQTAIQGVLRLEAILNTLVENKVESLKNDNHTSVISSPKNFLHRLKIKSLKPRKRPLSTEDDAGTEKKRGKEKIQKKQFRRQVLRQETSVSVSSPESQPFQCRTRSYEVSSVSDEERNRYNTGAVQCDIDNVVAASCHSLPEKASESCYCSRDGNQRQNIKMHFNDDYISLKIDGFEDVETDAIIDEESARRARRKRRKRRKKKMKKRLMMNPHLVDSFAEEHFKQLQLHDDELPPRAKWTIVATACLLLLMCLLLVGITLRMAPIIDEIVREENEKLINSISESRNMSTTSVH